ncbi:MAG TPA: metalloregulator ArsR/SmtB family transcription factor [Spirochaetota bacterium]
MNYDEMYESSAEVSNILKILGSQIRLLAVCAIGDNELSVQELATTLGTTQSNISQHLSKLKLTNILECRRDGNVIYYRVKDKRIMKLISHLQATFCENKNLADLK